jgi:hypothetical protein
MQKKNSKKRAGKKRKKAAEHIIFSITGGAGKNIMATAVVHALRQNFPDAHILVTPTWKAAWANNPDVDELIMLDEAPFFFRTHVEPWIKDGSAKVFRLDPYHSDDFIHRRKHLIDIWCELCGVTWDGTLPKLFFTEQEKSTVKAKLGLVGQDGKTSNTRPIFLIQASGGATNQPYPISWARDLPIAIAEEVVAEMNTRGFRTIQMRRDNQIPLAGAEWIPLELREAMVAMQFSDKRLLVDSVGMHTATALGLPSVVTWVTNTPKVFGYDIHHNLLPNSELEHRHRADSYLDAYDIMGRWSEHPYKTDRIFSAEEIIKALSS